MKILAIFLKQTLVSKCVRVQIVCWKNQIKCGLHHFLPCIQGYGSSAILYHDSLSRILSSTILTLLKLDEPQINFDVICYRYIYVSQANDIQKCRATITRNILSCPCSFDIHNPQKCIYMKCICSIGNNI